MFPHEHTVVMKFGGSSLADTDKIRKVARLVADRHVAGENIVVVVSAQGKTTDGLMKMAHEVSPNPSKRELDMLLTVGERSSMALLSMAIADLGHEAISLTGSQCGIITSDNHFNARIIDVKPVRILDELDKGHIVIVAGFQGMSYKKEITTLGRGGSDTTAVALAAALDARWCEIYSDVDGVYTADPRIVDPFHLVELSYDDMMQMAYRGAKVLNFHAVEFARRRQITVYARATDGGRETMVRKPALELGRTVLAVAGADHLVGLVTGGLPETASLLERLSDNHVEIQYLLSRPDGTGVLVLNPVTAPDWRAAVPADVHVESLFSVSVIGRSIGFENRMLTQALSLAAGCDAEVFCVEANPSHLTFYCRGEKGAALTESFHRTFVTPR
ncbi:aspartate kinase [Myxococcota bacterium]|nr:aspartate kinase [Myxococcota bacterium]MBU1412016.1 aspartate kinase [Myxococcota bacterium]MBU1511316.1 aspartate kinase [Myxococcota bacterium]